MIAGFDIGSRTVKIVVGDSNTVSSYKRMDTISFYSDLQHYVERYAEYQLRTTGYGRTSIDIPQAVCKVPELVSLVKGAVRLTGEDNFTLLDIGGQDSKIIHVKNGNMIDFHTNDKCAASSGRYLENMARILGIELEDMRNYYTDPVDLSSTCAIFGESEVVGHIARGVPIENIAAGVNLSVFKRVSRWLKRFSTERLIFTGGVSGSDALVHYIKTYTEFKQIIVPPKSEYCCAIGLLS